MELMPDFTLHNPETIEDAVTLASSSKNNSFLAGGTDLIVNIRRGIVQPKELINLTTIDGINNIIEADDHICIGAAVPIKEVAESELIKNDFPAVAQAASSIAGPTHQNYGTVGGNLCLDTRCLFYNQSEWWRQSNDYCLKERGDICHVAPGGKRCFAAFSGDLAPSLLIYGAKVDILNKDGTKKINLEGLYQNDGMDHLNLEQGELLSNVYLPKALSSSLSGYEKARIRGSIDFPLAGAAVRLEKVKNKKIAGLAIALTGVNPYPLVISGLEELIGFEINENILHKIKETVQKQAKPMKTTTVAPWYRRRVVGSMARSLLEKLAG